MADTTRKKLSDSFQVAPLWTFLTEHYELAQTFALFGPYQGASIFPSMVDDYTIEVRMPLVLSNINYVGTQFGGSLYSMCDPFYMLLLMKHLGEDYMVWDKNASIEFLRPGTGEVKVTFHVDQQEIDDIKTIVAEKRKTIRTYQVEIFDEQKNVVARVTKELYIRKINKK